MTSNEEARLAAADLNSDLARLRIDIASALARWPRCSELVALDQIVNGFDDCDCNCHF